MKRARSFTFILASYALSPDVHAAPPAEDSANSKWIDRWAPEKGMGELGLYGGIFLPHRQLELFEADTSLPDQGFKTYARIAPDFGLRGAYYPLAFLGIEGEAGLMPTRVADPGGDLPATIWTARTHLSRRLGTHAFPANFRGALGVPALAWRVPGHRSALRPGSLIRAACPAHRHSSRRHRAGVYRGAALGRRRQSPNSHRVHPPSRTRQPPKPTTESE